MTLRFPNSWGPLGDDPRYEGLLKISWAIEDADDLSGGRNDIARESEMNPEIYPIYNPLKLAKLMREAADRIELMTRKEAR